MTYGASGKSAAQGYTDFNKSNSKTDSALENSEDAANAPGGQMNMVQKRKAALKKRLLRLKGN